MNKEVKQLWGEELAWISDADLREKTAKTWELALERSVLTAKDLNTIPFTLLVPGLKVTFMTHKRAVVHVAKDSGNQMNKFFKDDLSLIVQEKLYKVLTVNIYVIRFREFLWRKSVEFLLMFVILLRHMRAKEIW